MGWEDRITFEVIEFQFKILEDGVSDKIKGNENPAVQALESRVQERNQTTENA